MDTAQPLPASAEKSRAWFSASIDEFRKNPAESVLGHIAARADYDVILTQRNTWLTEVEILRSASAGLIGSIFFEFTVPRIGRRVDVVLVVGATVFVIEFKVGERDFTRAAMDQVWDYGLDLKNFHEASRATTIVPILVITEATMAPTPHPYSR